MNYDINRPWLSLDNWQEEYINTDPSKDCFLLCPRQSGKTTAMSIKAVELCINHFKKGEFVLINSITEKQAYHMLAKAKAYAEEKYPKMIKTGIDRPTKHLLQFKNGTMIQCYAAGEKGDSQRGFTIKKVMVDEGSRMSYEYYMSILPMLTVVKGTLDIASTPYGKYEIDGTPKFFYQCSMDEKYVKFYVNLSDCPRHDKEFIERQRERMSKLMFAQEYEAVFTDELMRLFSEELINNTCLGVKGTISRYATYFLGVDVAGMGKDECTLEVFELLDNNIIQHIDSIVYKRKYTTQLTNIILSLDKEYNFKQIGVDDAGVGFGVFSELLDNEQTKRKVKALNNSSRPVDHTGKKSHRILKEEMYFNLLTLMENRQVRLLNSDEVKQSLASIQYDEGKIFGSYSHIAEGIVRAVWLAKQCKNINIWIRSFKV